MVGGFSELPYRKVQSGGRLKRVMVRREIRGNHNRLPCEGVNMKTEEEEGEIERKRGGEGEGEEEDDDHI